MQINKTADIAQTDVGRVVIGIATSGPAASVPLAKNAAKTIWRSVGAINPFCVSPMALTKYQGSSQKI
jgi:hypothetical protein